MRIFILSSILILLLGLSSAYIGLIIAYDHEILLQQQIRTLTRLIVNRRHLR